MNCIKESEIIEYEERLRNAMIDSNVAELDQLLSSDMIFTNHLGQVMTKIDDLEGHTRGDLKVDDITLSNRKVNIFERFAIVSVITDITGTFQESPANGRLRFTRVWVRKDKRLQVVAGHSCLISLPPA